MLGLCFAASAVADETDEAPGDPAKAKSELSSPIEILKQAQAALKEVKLVRYRGSYKGTAWITAYVPNIEGTAMLGEPSEHDIARFRCEVKLTPVGSSETIELTAGSDGDLYYVIDPQAKIVYADIDPAVLGSRQRDPRRLLVQSFVVEEPLAEELQAENVELKEDAEIGGVACYQILVPRAAGREFVWYIAKQDFLPRRVDGHYKNPAGELGTTQLELTDLVAEREFRLAPFELTVPEGFTRTDDFAP
jgi:hypothetical protein